MAANGTSVPAIAEAFKLAARVASDLEAKPPYVADDWKSYTYHQPTEAIAYTHADKIAKELEALAEEYENEN